MSLDIHDVLAQQAERVPDQDLPDGLSATLWAAGRRRRRTRRLGEGLVAATVVTLLVLLGVPRLLALLPLQPAAPAGTTVSAYPERIGRPADDRAWQPGRPLAAILPGPGTQGQLGVSGPILAVTQDGQGSWLPAAADAPIRPSLSPDGRWLLVANNSLSMWLTDLISGERELLTISSAIGRDFAVPVELSGDSFLWSPDSRQAFVATRIAGELEDPVTGTRGGLVIGVDGSIRSLDVGDASGGDPLVVGWGAKGVVGVRLSPQDNRYHLLDRSPGGSWIERPVALLDTGYAAGFMAQSGSLSPDGARLELVGADAPAPRLFDTRSGAVLSPLEPFAVSTGRAADDTQPSATGPSARNGCPVQWQGATPLIGRGTTPDLRVSSAVANRAVIAVDPSLAGSCVIVAQQAINGQPLGNLFGAETSWWAWHWPQTLGLLLLAIALMIAAKLWFRRRAGAGAGAGTPAETAPADRE